MTATDIVCGENVVGQFANGVNIIADAVAITFGPRGRNVILGQENASPIVSRDGATVAAAIELADRVQNLGAQLIREAAMSTREAAGDGTTTSTIIARAIFREGIKSLALGMNPFLLMRGIDRASSAALQALSESSSPCKQQDDLAHVGAVSSNGDKILGSLIAEAVQEVDEDTGFISVEASESAQDRLRTERGITLHCGYLSWHFVTDVDRQLAVLDHPYILICKDQITAASQLIPALEQVVSLGRPLLVIAGDIAESAISILAANNVARKVECCAIKSPEVGTAQEESLRDIAILTGATVIDSMADLHLSNVKPHHFGICERAEVGREKTILKGVLPSTDDLVLQRIDHLRNQLDIAESHAHQQQIRARLARLAAQSVTLEVAGKSDTEAEDRLVLAENAIRAVRAAAGSGVVPGGGVALLRARESLRQIQCSTADEEAGVRALYAALAEPLQQIAMNAGAAPRVVLNAVMEGHGSFGFDAVQNDFADLFDRNVFDSTSVISTALRNAAGVAGTLLAINCAITHSDPAHGPSEENPE